ncbi:cytochrome P460 family protein [Enhygromyxa salina]|nr:cytochrome P460 family protein [Enhygromyxa salina]
MTRLVPAFAVVFALGLVSACPTEEPEVEPDFPADYEASYVEVRDCRGSGDHDLNNIRILADPAALEPYQGRVEPFPVDAVVLKEEYEFGDFDCSGPIKQWTVMRRLPDGSAPDTLDWAWQRVDLERKVLDEDAPRCIGCHTGCGVEPDGYDGTCAIP